MSSQTDDNVPQKAPPTTSLVLGYPTLAAYIGATPELTIFRRFTNLQTQSLLYYQAELIYLEGQLRDLEVQASNSEDLARFARDWEWLGAVDLNGGLNHHMTVMLRIRTVMKEYNELLLQQAGLATLPKPGGYDLHYLQDWLLEPKGGKFPLQGPDRNWVYSNDLLALRRRAESDFFAKWVSERLLPWYHRILGRYIHKKNPLRENEVTYSDSLILMAASMLATTLAALLIVAPVVVLYEVCSMRARLGLMATFTVLFSLCVARLTGAKRTDVFAATAAFAAVQAVFLGSNGVGPVTLISASGINGTSFVQSGLGVK
ncbi:hypothetical protein F5882DRAFT_442927 [Hyaloscypha sp. PMI_1271]|nr:hypothetical protein F5882DRAFT_442927 [Hyaloscypha sp. PMI_1271]